MKQIEFTITKKIAKHGNQAIIVIPKVLEEQLKPGIVAQVTIEILKNSQTLKTLANSHNCELDS